MKVAVYAFVWLLVVLAAVAIYGGHARASYRKAFRK